MNYEPDHYNFASYGPEYLSVSKRYYECDEIHQVIDWLCFNLEDIAYLATDLEPTKQHVILIGRSQWLFYQVQDAF